MPLPSVPRVCLTRCASQADATAWLKTWSDNGSMHAALWKAKPGGQKDWKKYVCNAHAACQVTATIRRVDTQFVVEVDSTRQHAAEDNLKRRRNAPLDIHQEAKAKEGILHYGAAGKALTSAAQSNALAAGASPLAEKGVEGELSRPVVGSRNVQQPQNRKLSPQAQSFCVPFAFYVPLHAFCVHLVALLCLIAFRRA